MAVVAALVVGTQLIHHRHGTAPASSGQAVLEVRPLVAPGVFVLPAGARASNPLRALTFPVPTTAAEYNRLSATQQQQLRTALATTDCTHHSASAAPTRVACSGPISGRRMAFVLGPSLFGNDQIKSAEALAPSPGLGETQWSVALVLRGTAAAAFARYTTAHHTSDLATHGGQYCGIGHPPCDDVLGFVINGSVVSAPVTVAPINSGAIQMSGGFDKQSATALAQQLNP
jgi:preprotein translocase subunit SecD